MFEYRENRIRKVISFKLTSSFHLISLRIVLIDADIMFKIYQSVLCVIVLYILLTIFTFGWTMSKNADKIQNETLKILQKVRTVVCGPLWLRAK